ncbi:histidine phosphatase family protein [Chitinispirillales bacterium ANBcel5]|uniref:histidine phosphatase family protein n=1 Tax=Cellulosispirillum alkaliphilum TaxID=3039283 RepID=UPI002A503650|nr:histidine phosphatase family protein [Chitinispirillales bacterium ANBcel5]
MTKIFLIRHGICDSVDSKLNGRTLGVHLNKQGREQVKALSQLFVNTPLNHIVSSPLERAVETAETIGLSQDLKVSTDESFNEIDFGKWTGKSFEDLDEDPLWQRFNSFREMVRAPDGEMMIEVQSRQVQKVEELRKNYSGGNIAIVGHSDPLKAILCYYGGIDLGSMHRLTIDTASVSVLDIGDEYVEISLINYTGRL